MLNGLQKAEECRFGVLGMRDVRVLWDITQLLCLEGREELELLSKADDGNRLLGSGG